MELLIFPQNKEKDNLNDIHNGIHKALLVSTGLSYVKGKIAIQGHDKDKGTFSGSIDLENVSVKILKESSVYSVLKAMKDFKSFAEVSEFVTSLETHNDIKDENEAKDSVIHPNPIKEAKLKVLSAAEPTGAQAPSDAVENGVGKGSDTAVGNVVQKGIPQVQQNKVTQSSSHPTGKMKSLFKGKGKGNKQQSTTVKDLSQLPQAVKQAGVQLDKVPGFSKSTPEPKAQKTKVDIPPQANTKKENNPPVKQTPQKKEQPSSNQVLKEKLRQKKEVKQVESDELWPGAVTVSSMKVFQEKGYCIGHLLNKGNQDSDLLIVGTPKETDGTASLPIIFPDKGKAEFYFNAASSHPKLSKFMTMCKVTPLTDFKDPQELDRAGLLMNNPLKYIEHIINRLS